MANNYVISKILALTFKKFRIPVNIILFIAKEKPNVLFPLNKLLTINALCNILTFIELSCILWVVTGWTDVLHNVRMSYCQIILTCTFLYDNIEFLKMNNSQCRPKPYGFHDWSNTHVLANRHTRYDFLNNFSHLIFFS